MAAVLRQKRRKSTLAHEDMKPDVHLKRGHSDQEPAEPFIYLSPNPFIVTLLKISYVSWLLAPSVASAEIESITAASATNPIHMVTMLATRGNKTRLNLHPIANCDTYQLVELAIIKGGTKLRQRL